MLVESFGPLGLLICTDAFSPGIANSLADQGARLLISFAAWGPGFHGPSGIWERYTEDTGLAMIVGNRSGGDRTLNFTIDESVVVKDGKRLQATSTNRSTIFILDWHFQLQNVVRPEYQHIQL